MKTLLNAMLYQLTWLAAVGGAGHGYWWSGALMLLIFAAIQLPQSATRIADIQLLLIAAVVGFAIDSSLAVSGVLIYSAAVPWPHLAPLWIVVLWASFSLTMNHSLAFLRLRPVLAALFGGIGGPLAYWAAQRGFGAVSFGGNFLYTLSLLAVIWAFVTPLLCTLASLLVNRQLLHEMHGTGAR